MEEAEITKWISAVEQRGKSNSHRLDALEKQTEALNTLATSVAVMAEKVELTGEKVDGLCTDVQEMKSEPGKLWKSVVEKVIYIVVAAVAGAIFARLGLG